MKIYQVFHDYGEDGGFGDYIPASDAIVAFANMEDAEAFVKKFENPHVYDSPYADLDCGNLRIKTIEIRDCFNPEDYDIRNDGFWWLNSD